MKIFNKSIIFFTFIFSVFASAQNIVTFDDQDWTSDTMLDSNFAIGALSFSSNKNFYTNYGYNFDVYGVSLYFIFQDPNTDQIIITIGDNEKFKINSLAAYQVSEASTDTLVIEGWDGVSKVYTHKFWDVNSWQVLTLNSEEIDKLIIKLNSSSDITLSDFNFDNFSFNDEIPVELVHFKGKCELNRVILEWVTATELNNFGFEIERKAENTGWNTIGFVKGNGTSMVPINYSFNDNSVIDGYKYSYRLKQIDNDGNFEYSDEIEVLTNLEFRSFSLSQNYPNPFNPSTVINYYVAKAGNIEIKVYDMLGEEVITLVDEYKDAGTYSIEFSAHESEIGNLSSGVYVYKLAATEFVSTKKMILMK